jgi:hypothetical protein
MSFLNPALLAFAAAIAIPILIHLLNRRRFQRMPWAAMRFLRASIEKNRRRMEWEDLLLLILRCLVVALFALALARPALRAASAFLQTGRATAVIVIDQSASLSASDGTRTRLDLARQAAEAAVDAFPRGSPLAVLYSGDRVEAPIAEPSYDYNLVRKTLRETPPSDLSTDHAAGLRRAAEILRDQTALRKEIILVTDRQALGWRRLPEIVEMLQGPARDTRLRVVFVGEPLEENLAVSSLTRAPGFASSREPVRFHAEVTNHGRSTMNQVRATLHVNEGSAVDEALLEALEPGQTRRMTFFARLATPGFHAATVRLPADRMTADDERTAVVHTIDTAQILVVEGSSESNAGFFLRHALQPVPPEQAAEYFLQPRLIPPGQLAFAHLSDYAAVILADVPSLTAPAVDTLATYVRHGGALLCFPGPRAQPAFYNGEMLERAGILPAALRGIKGDPESQEQFFSLESGRYDHPVFALWNEAGAGSLTRARFRAAWLLQPTSARDSPEEESTAGRVMVRFADGSPAAVERSIGRGRSILFASTAGTEWNDLPVRPAFVPLLHRAIASLAEAREQRLNLRTGEGIRLRMPPELAGRDVLILTPGEPGHRLTRPVRPSPEGASVDFDEISRTGAYRTMQPGQPGPLIAFAAQLDPDESDLTEITEDTRHEIARSAQIMDWTAGRDLRSAFERERVGMELWLPLAVAVLLLAMTETWLAQKFSRSK